MQRTPLNLAARRQALLGFKPNRAWERAFNWGSRFFFISIFASPVMQAVVSAKATSVETIDDFNNLLRFAESVQILQIALVALPIALFTLVMISGGRIRTANILKDFGKCYEQGSVTVATPKAKSQSKLLKALDAIFSLVFLPVQLLLGLILRPAHHQARELGFESTFDMCYPATIEENGGKLRRIFVITDKSREEWAAGRVVEVYTLPGSLFAISGEFRDRLKEA